MIASFPNQEETDMRNKIMKTAIGLSVLTVLLVTASRPCFAVNVAIDISPERRNVASCARAADADETVATAGVLRSGPRPGSY